DDDCTRHVHASRARGASGVPRRCPVFSTGWRPTGGDDRGHPMGRPRGAHGNVLSPRGARRDRSWPSSAGSRVTRRALLLGLCATAAARGEGVARDPPAGLELPAAPRAGNAGATAVTLNPAGLVHLGGFHLEGAGTFVVGDDETSLGEGGAGVWAATAV